MLAYNHLLRFTHKYEVKPQFCVINFDDPATRTAAIPSMPIF